MVFIDDILVYAKDQEDHDKQAREICILSRENLKKTNSLMLKAI